MKKFPPQQVVEKLRQADVELGKGKNIKEACRVIEISLVIQCASAPG